ncbi:hypothetical protein E2C01_047107 [Portunus trituberculatus]|uniref:Uncharacterized protein n=1 Tax=Portunus trituberculatus TaxID=210409 RepID=A0A5B7G7X1_PORTR|nr:hypothetical protein [Portunus trituberculatus]
MLICLYIYYQIYVQVPSPLALHGGLREPRKHGPDLPTKLRGTRNKVACSEHTNTIERTKPFKLVSENETLGMYEYFSPSFLARYRTKYSSPFNYVSLVEKKYQ